MKIALHEEAAVPLLDIYPKDAKPYYSGTCSTMFIVALFVITIAGNNPDASQWKNGCRKFGSFTQ